MNPPVHHNYDVYTINIFRLSHTLQRNSTKLVYVRNEQNSKLEIFMSSLFHGKKSWNLKCKFKYDFSIVSCEKKDFLISSKKGILRPQGITFRIVRFPVQTLPGAQPSSRAQPRYETPRDLQVEINETQWLTSTEWGCPLKNGPKVALGQPSSLTNCYVGTIFYSWFQFIKLWIRQFYI